MPETSSDRAIGRLEGKLENVMAMLDRFDERFSARDESWAEIRSDIAAMAHDIADLKDHARSMVEVTAKFNALQQAIRDGTNQAKGLGRGFTLGIAFAAAGTGAAVAGLGKELWRLFFG